jgi:phosphoribosyl 1,2-cyclic phosphodiesterase
MPDTAADKAASADTDVYVAGWALAPGVSEDRATLWVNGAERRLSDRWSIAHSVFVFGDDTYVAGCEKDPDSEHICATLWVNGAAMRLSELPSDARSVFVSGGDVYVAGQVWRDDDCDCAMLWVNGAAQLLGDKRAFASSVCVSGGDVYVAGVDGIPHRAMLWKNGVGRRLSDKPSKARSLFASGGDVCVLGEEGFSLEEYYCAHDHRPLLWVNGTTLRLSDKPHRASSVCVSCGDVYVAGTEEIGPKGAGQTATIWKNGVAQRLGDGRTSVSSIFVLGDDTYVAGVHSEKADFKGHSQRATLWVNGVPQRMSENKSGAESVFAVRRSGGTAPDANYKALCQTSDRPVSSPIFTGSPQNPPAPAERPTIEWHAEAERRRPRPMRYASLASGSMGNCHAVSDGERILLIDAGIPLARIKERLEDMGWRSDQVLGVAMTHEHADHINAIPAVLKKTDWTIFATHDTLSAIEALKEVQVPSERCGILWTGRAVDWEGWRLHPFTLPHDAVDPVGYRIEVGGVRLAVATDLGQATPMTIECASDVDLLVLESNHDEEMLRGGHYPPHLKTRILGRNGHLSNDACADTLAKVVSPKLRHIVLAHLSEHNNTPELARLASEGIANGAGAQLYIANQDKPLDVRV